MARGPRHGFDRASIREPIATLFDDVHHAVPRGLHFAQRCRTLAAAALGHACAGAPRWNLVAPATAEALPERPAIVALHATSREGKLWPEERWRALLGGFADAGFATVLPWGSLVERARSERLAAGVAHAVVPPRQSLSALAALLSRVELAVASTPAHPPCSGARHADHRALFTETDPAGRASRLPAHTRATSAATGGVPALAEVQKAAGMLLRTAPRC